MALRARRSLDSCFMYIRGFAVSLRDKGKNGLKRAAFSLFAGLMVSAVSSQLGTQSNDTNLIRGIFHVGAIIGIIETIERKEYSGFTYAIGYFIGVALLGKLISSPLDVSFIVIILLLYLIEKII